MERCGCSRSIPPAWVPFLLAAFAMGPFLRVLKGFRANLGMVEKVMGVLLIITGVLFLTGPHTISQFGFYLLEAFPALGKLG